MKCRQLTHTLPRAGRGRLATDPAGEGSSVSSQKSRKTVPFSSNQTARDSRAVFLIYKAFCSIIFTKTKKKAGRNVEYKRERKE